MMCLSLLALLAGVAPSTALVAWSDSHQKGMLDRRVEKGVGKDREIKMPQKFSPGASDCLGGWNMMNPSLLMVEGSILGVFRGLCISSQGNGYYHWNNTLIIGKAPPANIHQGTEDWTWDFVSLHNDPRFNHRKHGWKECRMSSMNDISVGPEDPRLFKAQDKVYLTFNGFDILRSKSDERPECGEHGKFVFVSEAVKDSHGGVSLKDPVPLILPGMNDQEKNWGFFNPPGGGAEGTSLAVYSVEPHVIVKADLVSGSVTRVHSSSSPRVHQLAEHGGFDVSFFHLGGIAAHIKSENGEEYFLGSFHMHSSPKMEPGKIPYKNWPYKFSTKPPYEILDVGGQLPLVSSKNPAWGTSVQFVSSFMLDESKDEPYIVISYGSGDRMSRTLSMPLATFEQKFFGPNRIMWQADSDREKIIFSE